MTARYRSSRNRGGHECFASQIPRIDGFLRSQTMVTRQQHRQGLPDEQTERQVWLSAFPSKKGWTDRVRFGDTRRSDSGIVNDDVNAPSATERLPDG
jgi:hypothetical protein